MLYLGRITITGPEPGVEYQQHFVDALSTAMAEGWNSLFALLLSKGDVKSQVLDWEAPERKVLDHRIVGYSGGATIAAVLDGPGLEFEEAATSLATLGRRQLAASARPSSEPLTAARQLRGTALPHAARGYAEPLVRLRAGLDIHPRRRQPNRGADLAGQPRQDLGARTRTHRHSTTPLMTRTNRSSED